MSIHQGHGGYCKVGSNTLNIQKWTLKKQRDTAEITHSGSGGWRQRKQTLRDSSGSFEMSWDSDDTPESAGFDIGAEITLTMALGDSGQGYVAPAMVKDTNFSVDNQNGVVMLTVNWEGNGAVSGPGTL